MNHTIHLLLFTVESMLFGVHAKHVEELLNADACRLCASPEGYQSIAYHQHTVRCVDFTAYLRLYHPPSFLHVAEKHRDKPPRKAAGQRKTWQENDFPGRSGKILVVKHREEGYLGVLIEHPKKLLTVSLEQIHALPLLMKKISQIRAIWGIALVDEVPVILIDFERLNASCVTQWAPTHDTL